jgi:hypothetical protein
MSTVYSVLQPVYSAAMRRLAPWFVVYEKCRTLEGCLVREESFLLQEVNTL